MLTAELWTTGPRLFFRTRDSPGIIDGARKHNGTQTDESQVHLAQAGAHWQPIFLLTAKRTNGMNDNGLKTIDQFCAKHSLGRTAVYSEIKAGRLSITKIGRGTRIAPAHEAEWLAALPVLTGAAELVA